ncbi:MAG: phosphoglucosamine mutase [Clostridiales bacterium]|nr:phosphoglucosamine mutase [Clostridiales bacterium]
MKHFGTDGIRALNECFTQSYLQKIALGIASIGKDMTVAMGRDTRVSGRYIESQLLETLTKYGVNVITLGIVPSPTLAYLTSFLRCDYGIMLSASHNPPEYNGIKLFTSQGEKISQELEKKIESVIDNPVPFVAKQGKVTSYSGSDHYIGYLLEKINPDLSGVKVMLDTANGATSIIAPRLFSMAGASVIHINGETDGININKDCGATATDCLMKAMEESDADIGFSFDGDGDRVKCVYKRKLYDGDHIMYVHCKVLKEKNKLKDNVMVSTVMSNLGTERACQRSGIRLVRAKVGDKNVYYEMKKHGYNVGGEESGHVIFSDYIKTGDGMVTALLTACLNKEISIDLLDDIVEFPSVSDQIRCNKENIQRFNGNKEIKEYLENIDNNYRIVVRPSGTEPMVRILVESENLLDAQNKANEIKEFIKERIL